MLNKVKQFNFVKDAEAKKKDDHVKRHNKSKIICDVFKKQAKKYMAAKKISNCSKKCKAFLKDYPKVMKTWKCSTKAELLKVKKAYRATIKKIQAANALKREKLLKKLAKANEAHAGAEQRVVKANKRIMLINKKANEADMAK